MRDSRYRDDVVRSQSRTSRWWLALVLFGLSACEATPPATADVDVASDVRDGGSGLTPGDGGDAVMGPDAFRDGEADAQPMRADAGPTVIPPDPATVAPPLDPSVPTDHFESLRFLFEGAAPIQEGVAPGAIEPTRASQVFGVVMARDGSPLPGARVTVLGQPSLGRTHTRADGRFDLVVNGGGRIVVTIELAGFLPVQRDVNIAWASARSVDDTVMTPLDSTVTDVDLMGLTEPLLAESSLISDEDGSRSAAVLFRPGTLATMQLADGSRAPLLRLGFRATEFTVGANGPAAMPGKLPDASAYTYAVELSADEAIAAGATRIDFTAPVVVYVDNFIGFPAGEAVPAGYYDRQRAAWMAAPDGRVIAVVGRDADRALLDTDGDAIADDDSTLAALNIDGAERRVLAARYPVGASLWRVSVDHFTPWDLNWPFGPPEGAEPPALYDIGPDVRKDDDCTKGGSIIRCKARSLGQSIPIAGTSLSLNYDSRLVPGSRLSRIEIPLTGPTVPASVVRVHAEVIIAGRTFRHSAVAAPELTWTFEWDGFDGFGRKLPGAQAWLRVGFEYRPQNYAPAGRTASEAGVAFMASFAQPGLRRGGFVDFARAASNIIIWRNYPRVMVPSFDARGLGLGGWTISAQDSLIQASPFMIAEGVGDIRVPGTSGAIEVVAGTGVVDPLYDIAGTGDVREGIGLLTSVAALADGSIVFVEMAGDPRWPRARRFFPGAATSEVLSGPGGGERFSQAMRFVPLASLSYSQFNFYVLGADPTAAFVAILELITNEVVLIRVHPNGMAEQLASFGGIKSGAALDAVEGTLALSRPIPGHSPLPLTAAVGPDGQVCWSPDTGGRVWCLGLDGRIRRVAGTGVQGYSGDGGPAVEAQISAHHLAFGANGELYIAGRSRIRRVDRNGNIETFAGNGDILNEPTQDDTGRPATTVGMGTVSSIDLIAVGPDGLVYFQGQTHFSRIQSDGTYEWLEARDRQVRRTARMNSLAFMPDGRMVTVTDGASRTPSPEILVSSIPGAPSGPFVIPEPDGATAVAFDGRRRHVATRSALTNLPLTQLSYDAQGALVVITDRYGLRVSIERDAAGRADAIVGPYGHRTQLLRDGDGFLTDVIRPDNTRYTAEYHPGSNGLMAAFVDPNRARRTYTFIDGKLATATDPTGAIKTLTATRNSRTSSITFTTATGLSVVMSEETTASGNTTKRVVNPNGTVDRAFGVRGRSIARPMPDGSRISVEARPDTRWGDLVRTPHRVTTQLPSGLESTIELARVSAIDPVTGSLTREETTVTLDPDSPSASRIYSVAFDGPARRWSSASPEGRTTVTEIDALENIFRQEVSGFLPVVYEYDNDGRLTAIVQGTRRSQATYGPDGLLRTVTDAEGRTRSFARDLLGRVTSETLPDGSSVGFGYDATGNRTALTPPGRPPHLFTYDARGLASTYTMPAAGDGLAYTELARDLDGKVTSVRHPDARTTINVYDAAGRITRATIGGEVTAVTYATEGRVDTLTSPSQVVTDVTYDGPLVTEVQTAGPAPSTVTQRWNAYGQLLGRTLSGASEIAYEYDRDGLLARAGALSIARDPNNGLPQSSLLGVTDVSQRYSAYGEVATVTATVGGARVYRWTAVRDRTSRTTAETETLEGTTTSWSYARTANGQIMSISRDGALVADYTWDANGNRATEARAGGEVWTATHDDQDRLREWGPWSMGYTPNGDMASKTNAESGASFSFGYSGSGHLVSATLPDRRVITYLVDTTGRRVAKAIDGQRQASWVYGGRSIIAELDPQGAVSSEFIYGGSGHAPSYMRRGGRDYRFISDIRGSIRAVVDASSGQVMQRMDYDRWGQVISDTNPGFQPFGFGGGLFDRDTQLVRFGARDYDPMLGRWTQKDPLGFAAGDTSLYVYAFGDPVSFVDPSGEIAFLPALALAWAIAEAGASIADAMATLMDLLDPCLSTWDKGLATSIFLAGVVLPGGGGSTANRVGRNADKFFDGTKYTDKVKRQIASGDNHAFPESVTAFAGDGKVFDLVGGDGKTREVLEISGSLNGRDGVFEFIKEADGNINHRFFNSRR